MHALKTLGVSGGFDRGSLQPSNSMRQMSNAIPRDWYPLRGLSEALSLSRILPHDIKLIKQMATIQIAIFLMTVMGPCVFYVYAREREREFAFVRKNLTSTRQGADRHCTSRSGSFLYVERPSQHTGTLCRCTLCKIRALGDERHFVLDWPYFAHIAK